MFRNPKTTQERRATQIRGSVLKVDGYNIKVRARRNSRNLVDAWDDIFVSTYGHRSWKRHRRTRWKQ